MANMDDKIRFKVPHFARAASNFLSTLLLCSLNRDLHEGRVCLRFFQESQYKGGMLVGRPGVQLYILFPLHRETLQASESFQVRTYSLTKRDPAHVHRSGRSIFILLYPVNVNVDMSDAICQQDIHGFHLI